MKLSRRHAIGALVGGVSASPEMAKQAMANSYDINPPSTKSNYPLANKSCDVLSNFDRKQHLLDVINGKFTSWQQRELSEKYDRHFNSDSFKSVSEASKCAMRQNEIISRMKNKFIEEAKQELLLQFGIKL